MALYLSILGSAVVVVILFVMLYLFVWKKPIYTIDLSCNYDTISSELSGGGEYIEGQEVTLIAPRQNGYNFLNWTRDGEIVSTEYIYSFIISNETMGSYRANYQLRDYTISIDSQNGNVNIQDSASYGEVVQFEVFADAGYEFGEAYYIESGKTEPIYITDNSFTMPANTITIYFNYNILFYDILIDNSSDYGIITTDYSSANYGIEINITPSLSPGYEISRIYYILNNEEVEIYDFKFKMPADDITLYFETERVEYTISYNLNGGQVDGLVTSYNVDSEVIEIPNPTREGFTFLGWIGQWLTTATKNVTIPTGTTGNLEFSALWEETAEYHTFYVYSTDYNLGSANYEGELVYGNILTLTASTSQGTFLGWTEDSIENPIFSEDATIKIEYNFTSPKTYYALFNNNTTTVSYQNVNYRLYLDVNKAQVIGGTKSSTNLTVYDTITYQNEMFDVYKIASKAFYVNPIWEFFGEEPYLLQNISLPNSIRFIGSFAFSNCKYLNNITIPQYVTKISNNTFSNCNSLSNVTFLGEIKEIENYALYSCPRLNQIELPNGLEIIGNNAFSSSALTSVSLPESLLQIGDNAFYGTLIKNLFIPKNVYSIGLINRSSLTTIEVDNENQYYEDVNGQTLIEKANNKLILGLDNNIPDYVEIIGERAFYRSPIIEINIPNSVKMIEAYAFAYSDVYQITIPKSVEYIGSYAFAYCDNLSTFTFEEEATIKTISDRFIYSSMINEFVLPSSVEEIDINTFAGVTDESFIYIDSQLVFESMIDGDYNIGAANIFINSEFDEGHEYILNDSYVLGQQNIIYNGKIYNNYYKVAQ